MPGPIRPANGRASLSKGPASRRNGRLRRPGCINPSSTIPKKINKIIDAAIGVVYLAPMQIRTRLLFLVLSILVPAWLTAVYSVYSVYTAEKQDYSRSMSEAARAVALLVDNELETQEATLLALAKSPALRRNDLETFRAYLQEVVPAPSKAIILSSLSGQQLINTRVTAGTPLPSINPGVLALTRAAPTQTVISNLYAGAVSNRKDFAVNVPVLIDDKPRYRLAMAIEATSLEKLLKERRSTRWVMAILDRNGMVLARSMDSSHFVGRRASDDLLRHILAREQSGAYVGKNLAGLSVTTFFHRAPRSSWTVMISVPNAELQGTAIRATFMLTTMVLILLGLGIVGANWYGRRTATAIESLRAAAEEMGRGASVQVTPTGLKEVDLVGTALAQASVQVHHHQAELERRVCEAVAATERSQRSLLQAQKLEALGRLTGGIAHDFNNILQTLTSALQLIGRTNDLSTVRRLSETSQRAVAKGATLTAQLRAFGRVQDVRLETVSLVEVLTETLPLLKNALPANVAIHTHIPGTVWLVTIDRLQFELALLNVVINARDAMPSGGQIRLSIDEIRIGSLQENLKPGQYVLVKVDDNGTGMSPEVLSKALDPFFTTKDVDAGSGLGLAQAYGFATQSGGSLVLESQSGTGTTVFIYLPKAEQQCISHPEPVLHGEVSAGSGTVLFVEDDPLVRATVVPALAQAGFDIIQAENADDALKILASGNKIDVLFSDVVMPGQLSGIDLARLARERYPSLHVVLASGHTDLRVDLTNVRLLGKPYDIDVVTTLLSEKMMSVPGTST